MSIGYFLFLTQGKPLWPFERKPGFKLDQKLFHLCLAFLSLLNLLGFDFAVDHNNVTSFEDKRILKLRIIISLARQHPPAYIKTSVQEKD